MLIKCVYVVSRSSNILDKLTFHDVGILANSLSDLNLVNYELVLLQLPIYNQATIFSQYKK